MQGFIDACVFMTMVTSSASSGALLYVNGWSMLNLLSIPFVLVVLFAVVRHGLRSGWSAGRVPRAVAA